MREAAHTLRMEAEGSAMKALLIPLLIASTSALAFTTIRYAHRANVERLRADVAQATSQKHEARIRALEESRNDLEQQLMEAQRPRTPEVPIDAVSSEQPAPSITGQPRQLVAVATAVPKNASGGMYGVRRIPIPPGPSQSPAVQRYMKRQQTAMLRQQFQDAGWVLGLSQEQTAKLLDVLADQQERGYSPMWSRQADDASLPEPIRKSMQDSRNRVNAAVSEVIGESRMAQWADYQKSLPERLMVSGVSHTLERAGAPSLTNEQREQLVSLMAENRERTSLNALPQDTLTNEERMEQAIKRQDENNRQILERAKGVLTTEQYDVYRDFVEFQAEMSRNAVRNTALQNFTLRDDTPPQR
jgi:hypothetical protein